MKKFIFILFISIGTLGVYYRLTNTFDLHMSVSIAKGDTFSAFTEKLSSSQQTKIKLWAKWKNKDLTKIEVGLYMFSGLYTPATFINTILTGPQTQYISATILEGWSIYDIDEALARNRKAKTGEYIAFATDLTKIKKISADFPFLTELTTKEITTLEGLLYPDTYFIDTNQPFLDQLIRQQLKTFRDKVWIPYHENMQVFTDKIKAHNMNLTFSPYGILTLASVIEKEEKNPDNQPTIAGIFLHRLAIGMRLDADVSLCYGLAKPYKTCQDNMTITNLKDTKNPYNTRAVAGIPPTPIANPSARTIHALLEFQPNDYIYYLHDTAGHIHYSKTIEEHNLNKKTYLD